MSAARAKRSRAAAGLLAAALLAAAAPVALGGCGGSGSATAASITNEIATASFPSGHDTDEVSVTGAKPVKPCALVTKREAEAILGAGVKVSERLQGPTCVYSGSGREVTVVVMKGSLKQLREGARTATAVAVGDRSGYCLRYGSTSVVVGAGSGRVLQVTGPCAAGVRFAAAALRRLPS
jgi:hypothetical protein